ncbi:hypothetical protein AURDEDRAFT_176894 [Auricularia subglabra TFB-10046 SS5]|uniref:Uncharacterized protein n=1 Tax=Auricularia subglabra (strain TFB-10046 / SS5) TaxID=717982 RepID=J0LC52_AURST|nr:hypothetical protein AURDEDRAFT_176894 [Auricularia subglabra TFB-10046 SS5]
MAKTKAGSATEPPAAPRRSSRQSGVAQDEQPAPPAAVQGRGGGRRPSAATAHKEEGDSMAPAPGKSRGRARAAAEGQHKDGGAVPVPQKKRNARPSSGLAAEELPTPMGGFQGDGGDASEDEELDMDSPTPSKAGPPQTQAAFQRDHEEEEIAEGEPEHNVDDDQVGNKLAGLLGDAADVAMDVAAALTPSPLKKVVNAQYDGSEDEVETFIRQQKPLGPKVKLRSSVPSKQKRLEPRRASERYSDARPDGPEGQPADVGGAGEDVVDEGVVDEGGIDEDGGEVQAEDGVGEDGVLEPEEEPDAEERPKARQQTKAVQKELAEAARLSALEELGSRMVGMIGQLKEAGVQLDFAAAPVQFGAPAPVPAAAAAASPAKVYSRADNFKGDGSSKEGKPTTDGRKYGAVWGSYDDFEVGLNVSDYTRKNNDAQRDNTELFYPLVRKGYAMNRFRESYVAIIAMPVSGDLKGQTYAWGSPRLLQDLPDFLDDCAFEVSHGTMDKRAHGYARALADYKRKALKDLAELNRKHAEGKNDADGDDGAGGSGVGSSKKVVQPAATPSGEKGKGSAARPATPTSPAPRTPDAGQKRKRSAHDDGDEDRPLRPKTAGRGDTASKNKAAKTVSEFTPRRPFTPRNASTRGRAEDEMEVEEAT